MTIGRIVKVYDLAKELKQDTKRIIEELRREGADVDVPSNHVPKEIADKIRNMYFPKLDVAPKRAVKIIKSSESSTINKNELSPNQGEEKKIYDCELCKYTCQDSEQLKKHEEWHKEYFVYGLKSKMSIANVSEQSVISQSQGEEKKIYRCPICRNRTYHDLSQFVKHEEWHEKKRKHDLRCTKDNLNLPRTIKTSLNQSEGNESWICQICRTFTCDNLPQLTKHKKFCKYESENKNKTEKPILEKTFEKPNYIHIPFPPKGKTKGRTCTICGDRIYMYASDRCAKPGCGDD
jgi:hypothetical protein